MTSQLALIDVQSVFLFTIIVLGYIACFALWWFVFRGRGDE